MSVGKHRFKQVMGKAGNGHLREILNFSLDAHFGVNNGIPTGVKFG